MAEWFAFKGRYTVALLGGKPHLRATGRHLPYGITQCYLPPDTSERALPNPSHAGWYSIYLPRRDERLSWPSWLDSTPAWSRTSDLLITSPMLNRCTTKTTYITNLCNSRQANAACRCSNSHLNYYATYLPITTEPVASASTTYFGWNYLNIKWQTGYAVLLNSSD